MYHKNDAFSGSPLDEWLIYFTRSTKSILIQIIGADGTRGVHGQYSFSTENILSLQMDVPGKSLLLNLKVERGGGGETWIFLSDDRLVGDIISAGNQSGACVVVNSHNENQPVIRVENRDPHYLLEAYRMEASLVKCPLLVFGINGCEMVLEDYYMLDQQRNLALPENELRRNFVGSCRSVRYSPDSIEELLDGICLIVAISELIVKDYFMSTGP